MVHNLVRKLPVTQLVEKVMVFFINPDGLSRC